MAQALYAQQGAAPLGRRLLTHTLIWRGRLRPSGDHDGPGRARLGRAFSRLPRSLAPARSRSLRLTEARDGAGSVLRDA